VLTTANVDHSQLTHLGQALNCSILHKMLITLPRTDSWVPTFVTFGALTWHATRTHITAGMARQR
jgi:hypothetical protein